MQKTRRAPAAILDRIAVSGVTRQRNHPNGPRQQRQLSVTGAIEPILLRRPHQVHSLDRSYAAILVEASGSIMGEKDLQAVRDAVAKAKSALVFEKPEAGLSMPSAGCPCRIC